MNVPNNGTSTSSPPEVKVATFVTGVFADRSPAEEAWNSAISRGYSPADFSVAVSDESHRKYFGVPVASKEKRALQGAAIGGAIGSATGALGVALAVGLTLALPGFGVIVAGPIAAALIAAGSGAAVGGLMGGLVGLGAPESLAKLIEERVKQGHIVLTLKAKSAEDAEAVAKEWRAHALEVIV